MRRIKVLLWTGLAVACLWAAAPAQADFHAFCTGPASALPNLAQDGADLVFSGRVECPGAQSIAIDSLTVTDGTRSATHGEPGCTDCDSLTVSGRLPALPGLYQVTFDFQVVSALGTSQARRSGRWLVTGMGAPIQLCRRDAAPNRLGC